MKAYVRKRTWGRGRGAAVRGAATLILCLVPLLGGLGTASRPTPKLCPEAVAIGDRFGAIHVVE